MGESKVVGMTRKQVERAYGKLWDKMTEGDGYQPFGHDIRTLNMTHPGFVEARDRLVFEWFHAA